MRLTPGSPRLPVLPAVLALTLAAFLPQLSSGAMPFPQDLEPISVVGRELTEGKVIQVFAATKDRVKTISLNMNLDCDRNGTRFHRARPSVLPSKARYRKSCIVFEKRLDPAENSGWSSFDGSHNHRSQAAQSRRRHRHLG
ncbi:hypothetical protein D9C73_016768 [Collichthys lucidus]|uniref:Uncharacterized protein n=1 Tax=Collichthys lucidus TaxID=240159 RepID=A0A4U5V4V4_COLLU|nr:hypothetical protein D9C73_016768 [Collichthys lucidus]